MCRQLERVDGLLHMLAGDGDRVTAALVLLCSCSTEASAS
jgi:hypothetical protein